MSSPEASARPGQVTAAGIAVAVASVFLLLFAFDALGGLHSLETRDQIVDEIKSGNLNRFGITVSDAISVKRWALNISAVAAVVTGILGVFVLRRDKSARLGLTVAAVPVVLASPFTGSFLGMLIGAGVAVIWSRPGRDWFAGRPITRREPRQPERPVQRNVDPQWTAPPAPWIPPSRQQPPATLGWGTASGSALALKDLPPPSGPPLHVALVPSPVHRVLPPRQIRVACVLTWVFAAITALGYLILLATIAVDQQFLIDRIKDNPQWDPAYGDDAIVTAAVVLSIVFLIWCGAAAVIAVFTWRGERWAWVLHVVSAVVAGAVAAVIFPYTLVHLVAIGSALGMLVSRPARDWITSLRR